jgi:transposase-like protein
VVVVVVVVVLVVVVATIIIIDCPDINCFSATHVMAFRISGARTYNCKHFCITRTRETGIVNKLSV